MIESLHCIALIKNWKFIPGWVNLSKRGGKDGVFQKLEGQLRDDLDNSTVFFSTEVYCEMAIVCIQ